jgi:hypothetical protein
MKSFEFVKFGLVNGDIECKFGDCDRYNEIIRVPGETETVAEVNTLIDFVSGETEDTGEFRFDTGWKISRMKRKIEGFGTSC